MQPSPEAMAPGACTGLSEGSVGGANDGLSEGSVGTGGPLPALGQRRGVLLGSERPAGMAKGLGLAGWRTSSRPRRLEADHGLALEMSERPIARCPPVSPRRPGPTTDYVNATIRRED